MNEKLFFRSPARILLVLLEDNLYQTQISKIVDLTWSHVVKIIKGFEKNGLVKSKIVGRTRRIILTEDGRELALLMKVCREKMKKL